MDPIAVEALPGGRLVVWSVKEARQLFTNGFFGKPLGNPKPKEDFDEPLLLDLIEGVYLLEKGIIKVIKEGKSVSLRPLRKYAKDSLEHFEDKYRVYKKLRDSGYIATPGIKYGCDFAVYEHGPGIDHAPYIIQVHSVEDEYSAADIVKAGRLASTVRKTFIIAIVNRGGVKFIEFRWWKA